MINIQPSESLKRFIILLLSCAFSSVQAASVTFTVNGDSTGTLITPLAYGINQSQGVSVPFWRQGGNRTTGYNWENNTSNAGNDYYHNSDYYLLSTEGLPANGLQQPATFMTHFIERVRAQGGESLITLQMAGYVTADANGTVYDTEVAPSERWKQAVFVKGAPFDAMPDTTDDFVYLDELVNFLIANEGNSTSGGCRYYSLDNEPALWSGTHARLHPVKATYAEVLGNGVSLAAMVKGMDPGAEIFGPALYGWSAYTTLQNAADSGTEGSGYNATNMNFVNYYLAKMKTASDARGKRLLDFLDVHWYPEAQDSSGTRITFGNPDKTDQAASVARMQAPRSLWDPTYTENSWVATACGGPITLIQRLQKAVDTYYPGTKLAITEYNFGAVNHVSGGIAQADLLGIFGRYNVAANLWSDAGNYTSAAYKLFLNYDGIGSRFGDISIPASTSSVTLSSIYAARDNKRLNVLTVVALNKDYSNPVTAACNLTLTGKQVTAVRAFRFDPTHAAPTTVSVGSFTANSFTDTLPAMSATIYELTLDAAYPSPTTTATPTDTATPTVTPTGTPTWTGTIPTATFTFTRTLTYTRTSTYTRTITPTPVSTTCEVLFNGCESLTENGTWGGSNATRTVVGAAGAPEGFISQGQNCMKVQITASGSGTWNASVMNMTGFSPNAWGNAKQLVLDAYFEDSLVAGSTFSEIFMIADADGAMYQRISTPDHVDVTAGLNRNLTFNINYSAGSIPFGAVLNQVRFVYNTDATTRLGVFYVDNIRLMSGCQFTPTRTPTITFTPTRTWTPTITDTPTETHSPTVTRTPTATFSPTASYTPSPTLPPGTDTPTLMPTDTPTQTYSPTGTDTETPTYTGTPSPTVTDTRTETPVPTDTPETSHDAVSTPIAWPNPWPDPQALPADLSAPGTVRVHVVLGQPADRVQIRLYSTAMRKVAEQDYPETPAGIHDLEFVLRDVKGSPLANGFYYLVAESPRGRATGKLMILR